MRICYRSGRGNEEVAGYRLFIWFSFGYVVVFLEYTSQVDTDRRPRFMVKFSIGWTLTLPAFSFANFHWVMTAVKRPTSLANIPSYGILTKLCRLTVWGTALDGWPELDSNYGNVVVAEHTWASPSNGGLFTGLINGWNVWNYPPRFRPKTLKLN
jgi:hypothetical protein